MSTSNKKVTPDLLEKITDRFSAVSERIVQDIEHEIHQADNRMKTFVDQGEAATHRLIERLDKQFRSEMASLRKEVASLSNQLTAIRSDATRPAAKAKIGAPNVGPAKVTTRPAAKKAARKRAA